MKKFYGFYRGKVEDNNELDELTSLPVNMGRVRCRIMGIHSDRIFKGLKNGIPTNELPWCEVMGSLFGGFGITKAGISQVPEIGSWVYIMFENGDFMRPIVIGSVVAKDDRDLLADKDDITIINTKSGHKITINDKLTQEKLEVLDKNSNKILSDINGIKLNDILNNYIFINKTLSIVEINGNAEPLVLGTKNETALSNLRDEVTSLNGATNTLNSALLAYGVAIATAGTTWALTVPPTPASNGAFISAVITATAVLNTALVGVTTTLATNVTNLIALTVDFLATKSLKGKLS